MNFRCNKALILVGTFYLIAKFIIFSRSTLKTWVNIIINFRTYFIFMPELLIAKNRVLVFVFVFFLKACFGFFLQLVDSLGQHAIVLRLTSRRIENLFFVLKYNKLEWRAATYFTSYR